MAIAELAIPVKGAEVSPEPSPATLSQEIEQRIVGNTRLAAFLGLKAYQKHKSLSPDDRVLEQDDFIAAAFEGLVQTAISFDGSYDIPFGSYAQKRISGAVADQLIAFDDLPRNARKRLNSVKDAVALFMNANERQPTMEELSCITITGLSQEQLKIVENNGRISFISLGKAAAS